MAHPLHPALVHFPIGFWTASLVFDILSVLRVETVTANYFVMMSWYCILFGVIAALPTAITGVAEFVTIPRSTKAQVLALGHMTLNVLLLAAYIVQLSLRNTDALQVSTPALLANGFSFVMLGVSGYLGGKLAYEYRIGSRTADDRLNDRDKEKIGKRAA